MIKVLTLPGEWLSYEQGVCMKLFRNFAAILVTLSLSACAVMDLTHQNTAVPLPEGDLQVSAYMGLGLDMDTMIRDPESEEVEDPTLGASPVMGMTAYFGLNPDLELQGKAYAATSSYGLKLGFKHLIYHEDNQYISVIPAFTRVSSDVTNDSEGAESSYRSIGLEGSVINSWVLSRYFTASLGARFNYSRFTRVEDDQEEGPYNILHGGFMGNMLITLGPVIIFPEMGVEFAPNQNDEIEILPSPALGLGIKF